MTIEEIIELIGEEKAKKIGEALLEPVRKLIEDMKEPMESIKEQLKEGVMANAGSHPGN